MSAPMAVVVGAATKALDGAGVSTAIAIILISAAHPCGAAPRPSFDCTKAATSIERTICADPELAQWDSRMGEAFKLRYAQLVDNERRALLEGQRRWIVMRNGQCDVLDSAAQCILQLTKAR